MLLTDLTVSEYLDIGFFNMNLNLAYLLLSIWGVFYFSKPLKIVFLLILTALIILRFSELELISVFGFGFSAATFAHIDWETTKYIFFEYYLVVITLVIFAAGLIFLAQKLLTFKFSTKKEKIITLCILVLLGTRAVYLYGMESWRLRQVFAFASLYEEFNQYYLIESDLESITWSEEEISLRKKIGYEWIDYDEKQLISEKPHHNLILIFLEGFQADYTEIGGGKVKGLTPNLDKFASENIYFENFYNGVTPTINALLSSLCGILVDFDNYNSDRALGSIQNITCMSDTLKQAGYNQSFLLPVPVQFSGISKFASSHGYNYFQGSRELIEKYDNYKMRSWGFHDNDFMEIVTNEFEALTKEKPYNLSLFTNDTHPPYPEAVNCPEFKPNNGHLNSAHCTDHAIGRLLNFLEKNSVFEDTVIVLVADHVSHVSRDEYGKIYMAVKHPKITGPKIITANAYTPDIFPTVLNLLNVTTQDSIHLGKDVFSARQKFPRLISNSMEVIEDSINIGRNCVLESFKNVLINTEHWLDDCQRKKLYLYQYTKFTD